MCKHYSTLELHTILADADFEHLLLAEIHGGGKHLCVILTVSDNKVIDKLIVSELSHNIKKIGCRCVLDDGCSTNICV